MIQYEIRALDELGEYELVSIVETSFGGAVANYIASGSKEYCQRIQDVLEGKEKD